MKRIVNFDHASVGSLPPEVKTTIEELLKDWREGETSRWLDIYERSKEAFAGLIGTAPENVAGVPNISTAAGLVAHSMPLGPGSNIVVSSLEFPSNVYPWLAAARRGASIRLARPSGADVPLSEFENLVDDNTAIVAVSHVAYSTGFRYDLEDLVEVAHRVGAFLFVDAYQSVGAIKVDVEEAGVDFLCTGSSKWLMGPPGAGFLYVKGEVAEKLQAPIPSWLYGRDVFDLSPGGFEELRGASKFETGTPNYLGYAGTLASIRKISHYGVENVEKRILSLTQWFIEELIKMGLEVVTPRKRDRRAGIVLFKTKVDPVKVIQGLREEGIIVWKRGGLGVRASIHYINREDEVNYLIETLKEMNRRGQL